MREAQVGEIEALRRVLAGREGELQRVRGDSARELKVREESSI